MINARVQQTICGLSLWAFFGCSNGNSSTPRAYTGDGLPSGAGGSSRGPNPSGSGGRSQAGAGNTPGGAGNSAGGAASTGGISGGGAPPVAQSGGAGGETAGGATGVEPPSKCTASPNCAAYCTASAASLTCGYSYDRCVCDCEENIAKTCSPVLTALLTCAGNQPQVECQPFRVFTGCQPQTFDLDVCRGAAIGLGCAANLPACRTFCEASLVARCPSSPEALPDCLCSCENMLVAKCANEFSAFMQCAGTPLTLACAQNGQPAPTTCTAEWDAFTACQVK
ncbi:MAG: hypothetical protein SFV15_27060 [Polyangiaceae bacterium]|nr:hypothetical protein [Polyangiaceae bacterium]